MDAQIEQFRAALMESQQIDTGVQLGGYRATAVTSGTHAARLALRGMSDPPRRVCAAMDNKFARRGAAQNVRLRHALREQWRYRRQGGPDRSVAAQMPGDAVPDLWHQRRAVQQQPPSPGPVHAGYYPHARGGAPGPARSGPVT